MIKLILLINYKCLSKKIIFSSLSVRHILSGENLGLDMDKSNGHFHLEFKNEYL